MAVEPLYVGRFLKTMEEVDAYVKQLREVLFYTLVVEKRSVASHNKKGHRRLTENCGNINLQKFFVHIMGSIETAQKDCALIKKYMRVTVHIQYPSQCLPCMNEPIDVFDGDCFIGWLWDSTMAVANVRPFRPYGTPPPFDMDDYKDSFEIWQAQWKIFLELSTIDTALDAAERPRYKANGKKKKSGDVRSISVHSVTVGAVTVAELVDISVAPKGPSASAAQVLFLPDTGAELDAIPRETFRRVFKGVKLVPAASPETATGSPIMNFGTFSATLNWNADDDERRPITTTVHVLQDLKQAELSKSSQKKLGMWPESYPHARLSTLTSSAFTDVGTDSSPIPSLLFPHLLSRPMSAPMTVASLEPGITGERKAADLKNFLTNFRLIFDGVCRPMKVPPCHFELKADATPVSMRGSRPVAVPVMQMLRD
ncbi:uncharacterized protein LOC116928637 [Daphnia magna]|uniref:uncharacterized protein LOC116928637 n=1 Tax=Daphnia magna TaxID=35525 RepID=UPI001E1BDCDD|nr:uncharacterized protein LOC116928637 [Daphnia magna]